MKKKKNILQTLPSMQKFSEVQCLVVLVDFLELSMLINDSLRDIYYLMKRVGDLDMEKPFC